MTVIWKPMDRRKATASANKSAARLRVVSEKGDLYVAQNADGRKIKIGFSTRLSDRIKALNQDFIGEGPFVLLGSTISTHRVEQQLHRALQPFHQIKIAAGKELYPAAPALLAVAKAIVAQPRLEAFPLDDLMEFRRWCRRQAALDQNKAIAHEVHADRIAKLEEARREWFARICARAAARRAA